MKKNGFTLIELLAVIVILAIIALIATPIILSMINNARKSAAKSSTYGYVEAIDSNNGFADAEVEGYTKIEDGTYDTSEISVRMKGKAPDSGSVEIEKGKVKTANICINGFTVTYNGHEAEAGSKCDSTLSFRGTLDMTTQYSSANVEQKNLLGTLYLNPKNLKTSCTASLETNCMKFYIFKQDSNNYYALLDHNTTAIVPWNSTGSNSQIKEVQEQLEEDTADWVFDTRLIEASEIVTITEYNNWQNLSNYWYYFETLGQTPTNKAIGTNQYAWLFDHLKGCTAYGCNEEDATALAYSTSTPLTHINNNAWSNQAAWVVGWGGNIGNVRVESDDNGVRPVIIVPKSKVK